MLPMEFVNKMKKDGKLIMGIGHRVKSVSAVGADHVLIQCGRQWKTYFKLHRAAKGMEISCEVQQVEENRVV